MSAYDILMSLLKDFEDFAIKGNAVDMAVGIIVGGAFGKIVSSLVSDMVMPPVGKLLGAVQFQSLFLNLGSQNYPTLEAAKAVGAPTLNYGVFLQNCVDFVIIAFAMFLAVRMIGLLRKKREQAEAKAPIMSEEVRLLSEIRDLLQKR